MFFHFIDDFYEKYNIASSYQITLSLAIIFVFTFLVTRITKKIGLPNVTAYMLSGILLGKYALNLIPSNIVSNMSFISVAGLGIIGFSCGRFFDLKIIKKNGIKPLFISIIETTVTSLLIFSFTLLFKLNIYISLILSVIGAITSSSSSIMTIKQYECKGKFIDYLIEIMALNNLLVLFVFSIVFGIVESKYNIDSTFDIFSDIFLPIIINLSLILLGFLFGLFLSKVIIKPSRTKDNRLILTIAMLLILVSLCGICVIFDDSLSISPLLCSMVFSMTYKNMTNDDKLFSQVNNFCAPILLIFFVLSGMSLEFKYFKSIGLLGLVYFLIRLIGKYLGVFLGGLITRSNKDLKYYGGLCMYPCLGVSISLASIFQIAFIKINQEELALQVSTLVISSSVLFEIIGPVLFKFSLTKTGYIPKENNGLFKRKIVSYSMLKDIEENEDDNKKQKEELNKLKESLDNTNHYIHTSSYSKKKYDD